MDLARVAFGLVLLVFAGDALVCGAVNLALRLGISALIATIHSSRLDLTRSFVTMLAATVLFIVLCALGPLSWWHGLILLGGLGVMLWDSFANSRSAAEIEGANLDMPWWQVLTYLGVGLAGLPLGAEFLVEGSVSIASALGVSETVIGLTLVAVGTSLPELATSIMAALRNQADIAMGNVIGSNVFNLLGIIGVSAMVADLAAPAQMLTRDLPVMLGVSLLLAPFVLVRRDITRGVGVGFVGLYAAYATVLVLA